MSPPLPPPYSSMSDASHPPAPPSPPHPVNLDPHVLIQHLENLNARTQRLEQENKQIHEQQQQAQRQLNPLLDLPLPGMHATSHPALAIAGHPPHLKLRPPPPYTHLTGKMPLDVWLFQVERYLGVCWLLTMTVPRLNTRLLCFTKTHWHGYNPMPATIPTILTLCRG